MKPPSMGTHPGLQPVPSLIDARLSPSYQMTIEMSDTHQPDGRSMNNDEIESGISAASNMIANEQIPASPDNTPRSDSLVSPDLTSDQPSPRGALKPSTQSGRSVAAAVTTPMMESWANGDETLALSLPEKIQLMQLLDLAGTYLHLDYVYEAEKIANQMITLKGHRPNRSKSHNRFRVSTLQRSVPPHAPMLHEIRFTHDASPSLRPTRPSNASRSSP